MALTDRQKAILRAMEAVKKGASILAAAREFSIPRSTLDDKLHGRYPDEWSRGPATVLTKGEEAVEDMSSKESGEPMLCSDVGSGEARADEADELATLRDAHFVSIVRGYEELYMREHPHYADRAHRQRIWDEIGTIMNQPAENCKKRWMLLRQNYLRTKKRTKSSVDETEYWAGRPAHERLMSFLDAPHRPRIPTTETPDPETDDSSDSDNILEEEHHSFEFSDSSPSDDDQGNGSRSRQARDALPAPVPQESQLEYDDTVDLFAELGESITDFPEGVKIKVKREVFKIVIDAEEMLYNTKLKHELQAQLNICEEHE